MRAQDLQQADTSRVDFHPGDVWMPHKELAVVQGHRWPVECQGNVLVDSVHGSSVEASCDGCQFTVTATAGQLARSLESRPERWWQR